jgi:dolichyl-phosphate beta-glucosyltransferase
MDILISVIIPVYNENRRLNLNLSRIHEFFLKLDLGNRGKELVLVNDGSTDDTLAILDKFHENVNDDSIGIKIISYEKNRGKGYAIKQGVKQAEGQYIFFSDVDLSIPLSFFNALFNEINEDYPIVIGSRSIDGSKIIIRQPFFRRKIAKNFYRLIQLFFSFYIKDTNCGFKLFSARHGKAIFDILESDRWAFDFEFLYLSQKYGFKVKEVPVESAFDMETRVRLFYDSAYTVFELMKIKYREIMGIYPGVLTLADKDINIKTEIS